MPKRQSKNSLEWYFPSTGKGRDDGFADPLLEHFEGDHEKYIARETIQNAVDARKSYEAPVKVVFEHLNVPLTSLPGQHELLDCLKRCLEFIKGQKKAEEFFGSAIALFKAKKLSILKISDFNTKGLSGNDEDVNGNWYRLVRATGTSSPKGVAGGSFGIGKGAPFAASDLRTVFYSSMDEDANRVFQGVAHLVSHHDDDKDVLQGVGFYGINGYKAVRSNDLIPELFRRSEIGTDIFIIGYKASETWQKKLAQSILHNFWLAIYCGDLEVRIKGNQVIDINRETLVSCLEEYEAETAKFYFEAFVNPDREFKQELKHLGNVVLAVKKGEGYPKKVMMVRKPKMLVKEKDYRVLREPFAAVFICDNDTGNSMLRDLEPPQHNEWDKDRAKKGWVALQELDGFIKEKLRSMGEVITSEPQDIPGLDRYLPDSEDRDYVPVNGIGQEPTDTIVSEETGREVGATKEATSAFTESVVRKGVVSTKQFGRVAPKPPEGPGKGPKGRATGNDSGESEGVRIKTSDITFRSFVQYQKGKPLYNFVITAREDCEGAIKIVAIGDDGNYPVELISVSDARTKKKYKTMHSLISGLKMKSGDRVQLAAELVASKKYSLGIENYEG